MEWENHLLPRPALKADLLSYSPRAMHRGDYTLQPRVKVNFLSVRRQRGNNSHGALASYSSWGYDLLYIRAASVTGMELTKLAFSQKVKGKISALNKKCHEISKRSLLSPTRPLSAAERPLLPCWDMGVSNDSERTGPSTEPPTVLPATQCPTRSLLGHWARH